MISQLEKKIIFRYLKPKKKEGFINIISTFSFIGISLGVAVLIIVMSVMNGFRTELVNKIVGFNAHIIVEPYSDSIKNSYPNDKTLQEISEHIIYTTSSEGVMIGKGITKGLSIRGYSPNDFLKLKFIKNKNFTGYPNKLIENGISIGKFLSIDYNLSLGDKISIMSTSGIETIVGVMPKQENYLITSIFDSGLADFDRNIAFLNIENLENLFDLDTSQRNLEIYLKKPLNIEVNFEAQAGFHLTETPIAEDQDLKWLNDGKLRLKAKVQDTSQLRWWLLGFGGQVEVIKPVALREEFKKTAQKLVKVYK